MFAQMKVLMERLGFVATSAGFEIRKTLDVKEAATFEKDVSIAGTLSPAVVIIPEVDDEAAVIAIDPPVPGQMVRAADTGVVYVATDDTAAAGSWESIDTTTVTE